MARVNAQLKSKNNSSRAGKLLRMQPGEAGPVLLLGGAILATEAGYWMGGNGVDGLVFGHISSDNLPILLMIKGLLAFTLITLYSRYLVTFSRMRLLFVITLATVVVLLGGRLAIALNPNPPEWFYFLLWPLTYVVPDLFMLQAWGLASESFDSRQNKRLFPLITAVGAGGVVIGNFVTLPLASSIGSANLLLVWVGLVGLAFSLLFTRRRQLDRNKAKRRGQSATQAERVEQASVVQSIRMGFTVVRYYKIIGLLVIGTTLMHLLYWSLFKTYVTEVKKSFNPEKYSDPRALAADISSFFGLVGGFSTLLAFLLGLLVVNRLFSLFGVRNLVLVMPLTNLFAFSLILFASGFNPMIVAVAARFVHLMMTEAIGVSVNQTIWNLLPGEAREAAVPFNNQGISKQGGIVLAGVILLISLKWLQLAIILAFILSVVYFFVAWRMRSLYRPALVQLLREGQQNFFETGQNMADNDLSEEANAAISEDAFKAALAGLQDDSEGTRRLSAELLGQMGHSSAVSPLLTTLLADSSPEVRRTVISALVQLKAPEAFPNIAESLSDPDPPVRAEAAVALRNLGVRLDYSAYALLRKSLNDRDPTVRREAAMTLLAAGRKGEALVTLWEMGQAEEAPYRREAAVAYGQISDRILVHRLIELLDDFNSEVRRQAASSLGRVGGRLAVRALIANLEDNDPGVLEEIALALATLRHEAGPALMQFLETTRNGEAAACALHALTLAKSEEQKQARARAWERQLNQRQLSGPVADADTSERLLAPDGAVATDDPFLSSGARFTLSPQQQNQLLDYGEAQLEYAARMAGYLGALQALDLGGNLSKVPGRPQRDPADLQILLKSLQERYDAAILRVVGVVGLLGDVEALALVANGLQAQGRRAARMRADAIEALENFGGPELTPRLVDLLEGRDETVIAARQPGKTMSDILLDIWMEKDSWLQTCLLHVIGVFDLRRLRPLVEQAIIVEGENDYLIDETGHEALKRLNGQTGSNGQVASKEPVVFLEDVMQTLTTLSTMSRIVLLQKVPLFANLRPEDLRRVALVCKERLFAPGDIICYEGDPGDELYIVVSGQVQVLAGFGSGNNRVLAVNTEGEAVGYMSILDDIPRSATLRAHGGPVRLLILGADEFKRILRERPEIAAEVIRVLSRLLRETNKRIEQGSVLTDSVSISSR